MWTTRTATGRSWLGGGAWEAVFLWWLVGGRAWGIRFWTCARVLLLCVLCVCACVCFWGCACLKEEEEEEKSTTKSRAVRRLSPRRSCGPAAAHAEAEAVEGELLEEAADEAAVERGGWRYPLIFHYGLLTPLEHVHALCEPAQLAAQHRELVAGEPLVGTRRPTRTATSTSSLAVWSWASTASASTMRSLPTSDRGTLCMTRR